MCLYPKLIKNRKYLPNKKNGGVRPMPKDQRTLYVPVGCGFCIECRKQKANAWRIRLEQELRRHKYAYFVTLTINNETFDKVHKELNIHADNAIATILVRRFLERWRKKYKHSVTHWLITELGEEKDRLHLHGFIFAEEDVKFSIENIWKYGIVYIGDYCTSRTINYCVKYVLKQSDKHKDYMPVILCSKGIGSNYIDANRQNHKYDGEDTNEAYSLQNGYKVNLPIYYRNHFYTDEQKEQLWINKLNKQTIYVRGIPIYVGDAVGLQKYEKVLTYQQEVNEKLGFGNGSTEWNKKDYNITLRKLNAKSKLQNQ